MAFEKVQVYVGWSVFRTTIYGVRSTLKEVKDITNFLVKSGKYGGVGVKECLKWFDGNIFPLHIDHSNAIVFVFRGLIQN